MSFQGKTAIVTGATRGIGYAISLELGRCGCNIGFNYRNSRLQAEKLTDELKSMGREVFSA
jgi:3-oxoacyl-[acyl-carrier protein] reductase